MNLRKTLLAGALAFGLLGSIVAPTVTAQVPDDSAAVWVEVTNGGEFFAYFCEEDEILSSTNPGGHTENYGLHEGNSPTAAAAGSASGTLAICYWDDINYRGGFNTSLSASDFANVDDSLKPSIDKANLSVDYTYNVGSIFWGGTRADIGFFGNNAYLNVPGIQAGPGFEWTANNDFSQARTVHFGWNGVGTGFSVGEIDVVLNIPAGTVAAEYKSDITITVIPDGRTK